MRIAEGPVYADRVGGRLTFRDWEHWTKEDQDKWRDDALTQREFMEYVAKIGEIIRKTEIERVRFQWGDHVADALERAQGKAQ